MMRWLLLCVVFGVAVVVGQEVEEEDDARAGDLLQPYEYFDSDGLVEALKAEFKRKNWRRFLDCLNLAMQRALKEAKENEMVERSEKVYMPLLAFCRSMLRSLPPEGLQMYLATYSALAERELKKALESGGEEAVRRVALLYPLTEAASKALEWVADSNLERGEVGMAYGYLQEAGGRGAVLLKQAAALLLQGAKGEAAALLKAAKNKGADKELPIAAKLLQKELANVRLSRRLPAEDGLHTIKASPVAPFDFAAVTKMTYKREQGVRYGVDWDEDLTPLSPRAQVQVVGPFGRRVNVGGLYSGPYAQFVVVAGGKVVTVDASYIYARKLKGGKLEWRYPELSRSTEPHVRVKTVACDGRYVYGVVPHHRRITAVEPVRRRWPRVPTSSAIGNDLVAILLDSKDTAKVAWSAFEANQSSLKKTLFQTPPLVAGGRIYVGCATLSKQSQWDYGVACFSRSGRLMWLSNFAFNKALCTTGGILSENDGKIYYLTNGGLFACLDARGGQVEWVVRYAVAPAEEQPSGVAYPPNVPLFWKGVWKGRARRVVVIMPSDSEFVSAYDLDAKRLLWREERFGATSILGFYKDCVILTGGLSLFRTGKPAIVSYHVITGKIRLHEEVDRQPVARGLISDDEHLLLPCADGLWLLKLQPSTRFKDGYTLKEVGFWPWHAKGGNRPAAGNLLLYKERLICANSSRYCAYLLPQR